jgi:DNA-binding NarL/FixJ family response regulator
MTRVLLADDHRLVRHGLRLMLDAEPGMRVVAEAADGAEAVRAGLSTELDLAILDVSMPVLTGIHATRQLAEQRPDLPVLLLSMHDNARFVAQARQARAAGYVLKSAAHHELVSACRAVLDGAEFVTRGPSAADAEEGPLSPRESEVVKLIAEGHSSREIGALLHISDRTVERHRSNALDKLGLKDRVALTRYAIRHGLVEP